MRGTASGQVQPGRRAEQQHGRGRRHRDPAQRPHPAGHHVGELAGGDPAERTGHLGTRDQGACRGRRPVPVLDQPDEREGPDDELRDHQQHRHPVDALQVAVRPVGVRCRGRPARRPGRVEHDERDQERGHPAGDDRDPHRDVRSVPVGDHGHGRGSDAHADRLSHLPDAHREAAPPGREPADDDPAARDVAAGRREAGQPEAEREHHHRAGHRRERAEHDRAHQAGQQHQPLSAAVGHDTPRHQRQHHPGHRCGRDQTGLRQGQPLALVQHRDQERRAVHHHRGRRLGHGARREHRPAPANADLGGPVDGGGHPTIERRRDSSGRSARSRVAGQ